MAKKKETPPPTGLRDLKRDLAAGTPGTLYIFHGEETYLRDYYLERLKASLIPAGMESFNHHRLRGKDLEGNLRLLEDRLDALPMMSPRTLIQVDDYDLFGAPEEERDRMIRILSDLPDYCCLVFLYDISAYKVDGRMRKLAGFLREKAREVYFSPQGQSHLVDWIGRRFQALDHDISVRDAEYLIFLCGDLMNGLIGEIAKIGAYARRRRVTREDIDAVAVPQIDAVVFRMTDALTQGRFDLAFSILSDMLLLKQEPIVILAVLGKHIRQLHSARAALENGKGSQWLQEVWSMHSFPAGKLMEDAWRHDLAWCRWAIARCAQTDLEMKSVTGADSRDRLISLMLELSAGGPPC